PALRDGMAHTPFQYRVLVPFVLARVMGLFPSFAPNGNVLILPAEGLFHLAITGVCVFYLRRRGVSPLSAVLGALPVALLPFFYFVIPRFRPYFFPSDTAGCFFLLACLLFGSLRRWGWFSALFLLGTFNRETTVLALIAVALSARRQPLDRSGHRWLV